MSVCLICNNPTKINIRSKNKSQFNNYCSNKCIKTAYRLKNREQDILSKKKWILNNPQKRKISSKTYYIKNKEYYTEYSSLRSRYVKQAKLKSLTEWDEFYIREFYDITALRGLEVDHVIPLKHKLVCGLHVPENLQMLTRSQNARKNNTFNEDVICRYAVKESNDN